MIQAIPAFFLRIHPEDRGMSKVNSVQSLFLALLFLVILIAAGWRAWTPIRNEDKQTDASDPISDGNLVRGIRIMHFAHGRIHWTLAAPSGRNTEQKDLFTLADPVLTLLREKGTTVKLTAHHGEVNDTTGAMFFRDQVVVVDGDRRLTTEAMRYDPTSKTLISDLPFHLTEAHSETDGIGFVAFPDQREIKVHRQVRVVFENFGSKKP